MMDPEGCDGSGLNLEYSRSGQIGIWIGADRDGTATSRRKLTRAGVPDAPASVYYRPRDQS